MDTLYAIALLVAIACGAIAILSSLLDLIKTDTRPQSRASAWTILLLHRLANGALALGLISLVVSVVVHSRWGHGPGTVAPMNPGQLLSEHEAFPAVGAMLLLALVLALHRNRRQRQKRPMFNCRCLGAATLLMSLLAFQSQGQSAPPPAAIVGTWLLESIVDTLDDGSRSWWMGPRPAGAIVYSVSGHVSVQFMRDPRPSLPGARASGEDAAKLAGADPFESLEAGELRDLVRGYYAYFGRYEVAPTGDAITHFVETSLRPDEVGVAYQRTIRIEGDRLFISLRAEVAGVPRQRVLTWRRAALPPAP